MKTKTIQPLPGEKLLAKGTRIVWNTRSENYGPGTVLRAVGRSSDTNEPMYEIKLDRQITRRKRFIFFAHTAELIVTEMK